MKTYDKIATGISWSFVFFTLLVSFLNLYREEQNNIPHKWVVLSYPLIFFGMIILRWVKTKELDKISLMMFVFTLAGLIANIFFGFLN